MLFIYRKDATVSRIHVALDFYQSIQQGKKVITYREKAEAIAHDLATIHNGGNTLTGYKLTKGDETLLNVGHSVEKPLPPKKDWGRILIKSAKRDFKKFMENHDSHFIKHELMSGKSINNIYFKTTQKVVLF